jgi:hypothetical protein
LTDWVVVLDGSPTEKEVTLNPLRGKSYEELKPEILVSCSNVVNEKEMEAQVLIPLFCIPHRIVTGGHFPQFVNTWSLKTMAGIVVKTIRKAEDEGEVLRVRVGLDESTERASEAFDYEFT